MEAKHTPGPWAYHAEVMPKIFGNRFSISQMEGAPYTPAYSDVAVTIGGEDIKIQEANARLIAAAPSLLAALEAIDLAFVNDPDVLSGTATGQAIIAARVVLAKAGAA